MAVIILTEIDPSFCCPTALKIAQQRSKRVEGLTERTMHVVPPPPHHQMISGDFALPFTTNCNQSIDTTVQPPVGAEVINIIIVAVHPRYTPPQ